MDVEIEIIPALKDNYVYLLHDFKAGVTAAVDPSEAQPVNQRLTQKGWKLTHVLNTHHHFDHVGGNVELRAKWNCEVWGPRRDQHRIEGLTATYAEGEILELGPHQARVLEIPGHTMGHVALFFEKEKALFCGDTLFSVGCGRLFEGTPQQMWTSLSRLAALPGDTRVYCGHEYTEANLRFAATVEPSNPERLSLQKEVERLRAQGLPTIPSALTRELAVNPFLRCKNAAEFAELRRRKDDF